MKFTLKELRARKNLTQVQVAKQLGISVQTYNAWEKNVSNVAVSKVPAVAECYGVKIGDIFLFANMKIIQVKQYRKDTIGNTPYFFCFFRKRGLFALLGLTNMQFFF